MALIPTPMPLDGAAGSTQLCDQCDLPRTNHPRPDRAGAVAYWDCPNGHRGVIPADHDPIAHRRS